MASFYGCKRMGGADGTIINPIMSARLRTAKAFTFKYGKVEVSAKVSLYLPLVFLILVNQYHFRYQLVIGCGQPFGCFQPKVLMVNGQLLEKLTLWNQEEIVI